MAQSFGPSQTSLWKGSVMYGESGHSSAAYNFRSTSLRILTSSYRAGVSCPGTSSHHSKENTMADDDCDDITALLLALTTRLRRSLRACQLLPLCRTVGAVMDEGWNPVGCDSARPADACCDRAARLSPAAMFCALGWPVKLAGMPMPAALSLYWPRP